MSKMSLIKIDGKPLEKLIEVISNGIGTIYRPRAIRKEAEAKAYEIEIVERAKAKALAEGKEIEAEVYERMQERLLYRETSRQNNIDNVSAIAIQQLQDEETVSDDSVDQDWSTRFFNIVEDISDEEMQKLWGRILAGEVKRPKSYSLRTLETIRNLSRSEADTFIKVANFSIKSRGASYIFKGNDSNQLYKEFEIRYNDIATLKEIGLIQPGDLTNRHFTSQSLDNQEVMVSGNILLLLNIKANASTLKMPVEVFSTTGNELLQLIKPTPSLEYLKYIAKSIKNKDIDIKYANILNIKGDIIEHTQPLQEFN